MAKTPINDISFENLIDRIKQETSSKRNKFDIAYYSKGYFSGPQASILLTCYKSAPEKTRLIKILEPRLCRMNCQEAKDILTAVPLTNNDRLFTLNCLKRTLTDHHSTSGMEYILSAFEFDHDKLKALGIVQTVSSYVSDKLASGGHQLYAPVGGLDSQNFPINEHMYGFVEEQMTRMPGQGNPAVIRQALPIRPPSFYRSQASNACRPDLSYDQVRGYPGVRGFPEEGRPTPIYPRGSPPVHQYFHQGAIAPTDWQSIVPATEL